MIAGPGVRALSCHPRKLKRRLKMGIMALASELTIFLISLPFFLIALLFG